MFSNLSSWFYGSNPTEKTDEAVVNDPCPDSLIEIDENFEQFEPIEIDESDEWVILGKGKLVMFFKFCCDKKMFLITICLTLYR